MTDTIPLGPLARKCNKIKQLTVAPLLADVLEGKLDGHMKLDARTDPPTANVDLKISNLQLSQIHRTGSGPPPIEGLLQARVVLTGKGSSVHQVAASANGTVTAMVQQGEIRDSVAELTGIDLRGLGLLLAKDQKDTALRCATAVFKDHEGTLTAQSLVADTEPVLITGEGQIHLDTEALDLTIRGQPKSTRFFRFRSPVLVKGTLSHPSISIQEHKLAIIDPGQAKDTDCAAAVAAVNSSVADSEATPLHPRASEH